MAVIIDRTIARAAEASGSPAMIDAGISADVDNPPLALTSLHNDGDGVCEICSRYCFSDLGTPLANKIVRTKEGGV